MGRMRRPPDAAAPDQSAPSVRATLSFEGASPLRRALVGRIVEWARTQKLQEDAALTELGLAQQLGVSRTPVRAALALLEAGGLVRREPGAGYRLAIAADRLAVPDDLGAPVDEADRLFVEIARDRNQGGLPNEVSESDLMRRYQVTRPTVLKVLARLAEVGQVERKAGRGWSFAASGYDVAMQDESYRFRMLIEPAALLAPEFRLEPEWIAQMREQHHAMLARPWRDTYGVALFDLNEQFHQGLANASGNRFLSMAIAQQNRLRRFVNVHWIHGPERVQVSCREHLEMLDRLAEGDNEVAAVLMRRHLERASVLDDPGS